MSHLVVNISHPKKPSVSWNEQPALGFKPGIMAQP